MLGKRVDGWRSFAVKKWYFPTIHMLCYEIGRSWVVIETMVSFGSRPPNQGFSSKGSLLIQAGALLLQESHSKLQFSPKISIFSPGNSTNIARHTTGYLFKRIPLNRPPPVLENEMHHIIRADLLSSKAGLASVPWWVEDHDRLRTFPRFFW